MGGEERGEGGFKLYEKGRHFKPSSVGGRDTLRLNFICVNDTGIIVNATVFSSYFCCACLFVFSYLI